MQVVVAFVGTAGSVAAVVVAMEVALDPVVGVVAAVVAADSIAAADAFAAVGRAVAVLHAESLAVLAVPCVPASEPEGLHSIGSSTSNSVGEHWDQGS